MESLHYQDAEGKHSDITIWDGSKDAIRIEPDGCIVLNISGGARLYKCGLTELLHALEFAGNTALEHAKLKPNELWDLDRDCGGWEE